MIQTSTSRLGDLDWVEQMLAMCTVYDEELAERARVQDFFNSVPCGQLRCELRLALVWDVEGVWVVHNGVVKVISYLTLMTDPAAEIRQELTEWLREQHVDLANLGDGAVQWI